MAMRPGRDFWWHELMADASADCPAEPLDSETPPHPLHQRFDRQAQGGEAHDGGLQPLRKEDDGVGVRRPRRRRFLVCGGPRLDRRAHVRRLRPVCAGVTTLMYEGALNWPDAARIWEIIQRHRATIFYTSSTAIRSFITWGDHWLAARDLSSLRLLGTMGEGTDPQAWMWCHRKVGGEHARSSTPGGRRRRAGS